MPIKDELGWSLMDCHFTNDGFPSAKNERTWGYSVTVVVRGKLDMITHNGIYVTNDGEYVTYG